MNPEKKIRVLVVDDQAIVREKLSRGLAQDPLIEVIGKAANPYIARDKIVRENPDVITLDVEMPGMSGIEFLRYLMPQFPLPVIMVSSLTEEGKKTTLEALDAGAVDFVTKPDGSKNSYEIMIAELCEKVKNAAKVDLSKWIKIKNRGYRRIISSNTRNQQAREYRGSGNREVDLIAIGASTGGTQAIREILSDLPAQCPGIIIVQHMPPGFTKTFADSLNKKCSLHVKEAEEGDIVAPGTVLIAPGMIHVKVVKKNTQLLVRYDHGQKISGHKPSVNCLFDSVSTLGLRKSCIGIILTGMGSDGATGLLNLKNAGGITIGQDLESSIVYGMPKAAYDIGAVRTQLSLANISQELSNLVGF